MIRHTVLFLAAIAFTACGTSSPKPESEPRPLPVTFDGPRLTFVESGHHFGDQEKRVRVSHTAVFYNTGREDLEISGVKTHCGCAAALLSSETIPPGGRGTLRVTLETGTLAGRRSKKIEVFTNSPTQPVAVYPISCVVLADIRLDPLVLVIRSTRASGKIEGYFEVVAARPGFEVVVEKVTTSGDLLLTEIVPRLPGDERGGIRVRVTVREDFVSGDFHERLTVHTNSRRDAELTLVVIGSVRQEVLVVPERLYFPSLEGGRSVTRLVYVSRTDEKPLAVAGVEDPTGIFDTAFRRLSDTKWEISLTLAGEAPEATVRGSLVVLTDSALEPRVPVQFEVAGAAK